MNRQGDDPWPRPFPQRGAKLIPPPTADDPFETEAYRLWAIKQQGSRHRREDTSVDDSEQGDDRGLVRRDAVEVEGLHLAHAATTAFAANQQR